MHTLNLDINLILIEINGNSYGKVNYSLKLSQEIVNQINSFDCNGLKNLLQKTT
jgi:hypothetical protein